MGEIQNPPAPLIGCCGWPEGKAKYFAHFPAVELQSTFYEPPSLVLAEKWRALAPPSFLFCIKAWQLITHPGSSPTYRRLKSRLSAEEHELVGAFRPTEQVWLAWERTAAIAESLRASVILFQCPPSFQPTRENIANFREFFGKVIRGASTLAWEPRGDWPDELVGDLCSEFNLLHCYDPLQQKAIPGRPAYWRLHGKGGYSYKYSDADLTALARTRREYTEALSHAPFLFFNNIWMKDDAMRFQDILRTDFDCQPSRYDV